MNEKIILAKISELKETVRESATISRNSEKYLDGQLRGLFNKIDSIEEKQEEVLGGVHSRMSVFEDKLDVIDTRKKFIRFSITGSEFARLLAVLSMLLLDSLIIVELIKK